MNVQKLVVLPIVLLIVPLFSGCVDEPLHIAVRVASGQSRTITSDLLVEGSLLVEPNATLILTGATVTIQQALLVQGRLFSTGSALHFVGPFERHEAQIDGETRLASTTMDGLTVIRASAPIVTVGGAIATRCLSTSNTIDSNGTAWSFPTGDCYEPSDHWRGGSTNAPYGAILVHSGTATFERGSMTFSQTPAMRIEVGALRIGNLTLDASNAGGNGILAQRAGRVDMWGVTIHTGSLNSPMRIDAGTTRLVDSPLPRNALPPSVAAPGRLEVAWTLAVHVVTLLGQAPVGGINVTMTGAAAPDSVEDHGVTDAKGDVRLVALEFVSSQSAQSRSGNPHLVRAQGGGKDGASPAVVVESPASVTVSVLDAPATALARLGLGS